MTAPETARDRTFEILRARGVRHIFGNPGTTELDLISALPSDIEYVLCLQEAIAVGAATGYALTGCDPAVVSLHALPGVGHAMGALHGARLMHVPLVALVGQQHSHHLHREPLLYGDIVETARPAARWAFQPARPDDVPHAVERAFRIAASPPRGPAVVAVPMDFWDQPADPAPVAALTRPPVVPRSVVRDVRTALTRSGRGVLITGDRGDDPRSWDAAVRIAETFDLSVFAAPIGTQPGFPTDHPRFEGNLPLTGSGIRSVLEGMDVALVVGAPVFTVYLHDQLSVIPEHVDLTVITDDPAELARSPVETVHLGDPAAFLIQLARNCDPPSEYPRRVDHAAASGGLDAGSVAATVASLVGDGAVFVDESMTSGDAVRSNLAVRTPGHFIRTSNGVLGTGMSAAVGAALASPGDRVVAFVGDGSFLFAPQALWTASQRGLDVIVVVLDNGGYESLRGYERASLQHLAPTPGAFDIESVDIAGLSESLGARAVRAGTSDEVVHAIEEALERGGPTVIVATMTPQAS